MSDNGALSPAIKQLLPGNTLYLRLPSDSAIGMIQPVLQRFSGPKPVILYIESTGAKLRAPQNSLHLPDPGIDRYAFGYARRKKCRFEIIRLVSAKRNSSGVRERSVA